MRRFVPVLASSFALAAAALGAGCMHGGTSSPLPPAQGDLGPVGEMTLDRGDWLVGRQVGVWVVLTHPFTGAAERVGYVTERHYREVRGGPALTMYEVTTTDRKQVAGTIDGLGNAKRFRPRRGGGITTESLGNSTLELNVQAILDSKHPVTLEATSEGRLAFEALDANHDGFLDKTEFPRLATRLANADLNGDGKIDLQEFLQAMDY